MVHMHVYIRVYHMVGTPKSKRRTRSNNRSGVPLVVYLEERQASKLDEVSRERRITKTAIVKFAVDRLFLDMSNGQLDLPLGLENINTK
jgi:hypothetical protein